MSISDIFFIIIGTLGFLEFTFVRGLFTGTAMMLVCAITGIIAVIFNLVKKNYRSAILYALLFATICSGYINLM